MLFNSNPSFTSVCLEKFSNDQIKNEEMFFNSDLNFAYEKGGPITRDFINKLPSWIKNVNPVLDSRVHMLMKGWFPAIPGFHHDDIPRTTASGQPNYENPEYSAKHLMALQNAEICPTEFVVGSLELEIPKEGIIYKQWHKEIVKKLEREELRVVKVPDRCFVYFGPEDFHQSTRAVSSGWRWFVRISWDTDRQNKITNEIRRNCQVYLENPMEGW